MIRLLVAAALLAAAAGCGSLPPEDYRCNQGFLEHYETATFFQSGRYKTLMPLTACTPTPTPTPTPRGQKR